MPADRHPEALLARSLMETCDAASLATLMDDGAPFASLVITASAVDGSPLLLLSNLALHTRNLARDPRAALLFVRQPDTGSDQMTAVRLTVTGRALPDENAATPKAFLARHPEAAGYSGFADFSFYRFRCESGHLVAGFGRIASLTPADLLEDAANR